MSDDCFLYFDLFVVSFVTLDFRDRSSIASSNFERRQMQRLASSCATRTDEWYLLANVSHGVGAHARLLLSNHM